MKYFSSSRLTLCFTLVFFSYFLLLNSQILVNFYNNNNANGNLITSELGGNSVMSVQLAYPPNSTVQVYLESTNSSIGYVFPQTLTFDSTNWNISTKVVVTGRNDSGNGASYTPYGIDAITQVSS